MADDCTQGPWAWEHRATEDGKHIATILVTKHRPVPCNDPAIFALREDWMGNLSPEREAAKQLILATPQMRDALIGARKALLKALPLLPPDNEGVFCGEWLIEINEVLGQVYGWDNGQPNVPDR